MTHFIHGRVSKYLYEALKNKVFPGRTDSQFYS